MAPKSATSASSTDSTGDRLESFVGGRRGRALRHQLASRNPDLDADTIEEAIQYACKSFLDEAEGITDPGAVYTWIRTAATRSLGREVKRRRREVLVASDESGKRVSEVAGPAEELIELEDDADLEVLVSEVASSLSERRRDVLALYGAGYKRPQIADRLGVPERVVKRDLLEIMEGARVTLARLVGGGCKRGEPLVMRLVFGTATPDESEAARDHLSHCGRCELFNERLIAWREKAGAMLPAPVAEGASPGVVRQVAESAGEKFSAFKQHIVDGSAQVKQHVAQRAVDPMPFAAARPGTAVAVVASCVAIGGGAAACVEQGVDPLGAAKGLIASAPEEKVPEETAPPPEAESTGPTYTPVETPAEEEPVEPAPEPSPQPQPEPQPKPEPKAEPAPEESFEPASTSSQSSETESESSYEATEEAPPPEPAPAPASAGQQFGGP